MSRAKRSEVEPKWAKLNADGFVPRVPKAHIHVQEKTPLGASLGLRLTSRHAVIRQIKAGLPMRSFEHLGREIALSTSSLAEVAGISPRTLARRREQGRLTPAESERVCRLAFLFEKATQVLGAGDEARRWFTTSKTALKGRSPIEYSDTEVGAREVEDLLGRLEHGVFS